MSTPIMHRVWAMPSTETFTIRPIRELVENSLGLGRKHGMELEEILMVNHGDQNDTIVTVGRKVAAQLDLVAANFARGLSTAAADRSGDPVTVSKS